jgi:hypothetical protein
MRKSIISSSEASTTRASLGKWLDLETIASVQITSEDPEHPFEDALRAGNGIGWKAAEPGPQLIRLSFDNPLHIRGIRLTFREEEIERAQEFAVFITSVTAARKEVFRQQWTFSPGGSTSEVEDLAFDLPGVTLLELRIDPGRHNKHAIATLGSMEVR